MVLLAGPLTSPGPPAVAGTDIVRSCGLELPKNVVLKSFPSPDLSLTASCSFEPADIVTDASSLNSPAITLLNPAATPNSLNLTGSLPLQALFSLHPDTTHHTVP